MRKKLLECREREEEEEISRRRKRSAGGDAWRKGLLVAASGMCCVDSPESQGDSARRGRLLQLRSALRIAVLQEIATE